MKRRNPAALRQTARRVAVALMFGWNALCLVVSVEAAGKPQRHTIVIEGMAYQPAAIVVKRGDTVTWINKDAFPHTVTAAGAFDSHDIASGASWTYVARKAGSYAYLCTLHPTMRATLTIE